jgi:transcriptional regulator with XRE-family HTH domain
MARASSKRKSSVLAREFGKRLRSLREDRGLTQRELAARLHTPVPQISRYETGFCLPNAETLAELADVLRIDLGELLLGRKNGNLGDEPQIKDVRLLERVQELEKLDRRFRDTAIAVLEAIIIQGHDEGVKARLTGSTR